MLTKQANDSWRACFATRTPPRGAGIKGSVHTHNSFSLRSRAFQRISESVCKTANWRWCYGASAVVAVQCCFRRRAAALHSAVALRPPLGASAQKKNKNKKELIQKSSTSDGRLFKDGGRFLASSDGNDRCPSCLGYQHAEAALVDESCSHCGNMTIAMLRSRCLLAKRGGVSPSPCPVLAPPGFRGLLRLMVRVI